MFQALLRLFGVGDQPSPYATSGVCETQMGWIFLECYLD